MKNKPKKIHYVFALIAFAATSLSANALPLMLHYDFTDVTGTTVTDISGNGNHGTIGGKGIQSGDEYGVSGKSGDYAFDNSSSTMGSGTANTGGAVATPNLGSLTSFTITMWFKADASLGNARLFDNSTMLLAAISNGQLHFKIAEKNSNTLSGDNNALINTANEWIFVSITYDGADTDGYGNLNVYVGSKTTGVSLILSNTEERGISYTGAYSMIATYFGGTSSYGRALDGLIDDIRIYGDAAGSSGALSVDALNGVRLEGALGIPEPRNVAAIIGGLMLVLLPVLHRCKRSDR